MARDAVVDIADWRGGIVRSASGILFPLVYRIEGCVWRVDDGRLVATDERAPPVYAIDKGEDSGLANVRHTRIEVMDPAIDRGCITVRWHSSWESVDGWIGGLIDFHDPEYFIAAVALFKTPQGLFTIGHRAAVEGRPDHLIIYADTHNDWIKIVSPVGALDESVLLPETA